MSGDFLKSDRITVANHNGRDKWLVAARNAYQAVIACLNSIPVIASEAKQSMEPQSKYGLLRRFAPRNDGVDGGAAR
jgi:hypothetical protein